MDFESNCKDADDELQIFENTPETKNTAATNASIGCGISDSTKFVGASGKRISNDVGKEVVAPNDIYFRMTTGWVFSGSHPVSSCV